MKLLYHCKQNTYMENNVFYKSKTYYVFYIPVYSKIEMIYDK